MPVNIKAIAAYVRVSTDRQAKENHSLEDQERCIKAWADENGYEIVEIYKDEGKSAYKGRRPAFEQMLQDIDTGKIRVKYVVALQQSRIARNEKKRLEAQAIIGARGVKFRTLLDPLPEDENDAHFISGLNGLFNEHLSRTQSKLAAVKLNNYAEMGYFTGSIPPYGFDAAVAPDCSGNKKRKILVLNAEEAKIVATIYSLASEGTTGRRFGVKNISSYLNEKGILRRGKKWTVNQVHRVLTDTIYYGERVYGKRRIRSDLHPEPVIQNVPQIISKELFEELKLARKQNAPHKNNHQAVSSPSLLTGILRCADCGGPMVINTGKSGKYKYYKCKTRIVQSTKTCSMRQIRKETLDSMILEALKSRVFTLDAVEALIEDVKSAVQEKYAEIRSQLLSKQAKRASIERDYDTLISAVASAGVENATRIKHAIMTYEAQLTNIEKEIEELKRSTSLPLRKFGDKQVREFVEAAVDVLIQPDHDACKSLLAAAVDSIVVKKHKVAFKGSKLSLMALVSRYENGHSEFKVPIHISNWRRVRDSNPRWV